MSSSFALIVLDLTSSSFYLKKRNDNLSHWEQSLLIDGSGIISPNGTANSNRQDSSITESFVVVSLTILPSIHPSAN